MECGYCFVIQPFDKSRFDKRFEDHFAPAIRAAGLEPYRVDNDLSVRVPIDSIHQKISEAEACLADITTDNPNVWYELGYALAGRKEVILVCSEERPDNFPFDIRHLNIIKYSTSSGRDFKQLENNITGQLAARLKEREKLQTIASMSPLTDVQGLSPHETAALVVLASNAEMPGSPVAPWTLREEMSKAGFTPIAVNLSAESLLRKKMLKTVQVEQSYGQAETMFQLDTNGLQWLLANEDRLILRYEKQPKVTQSTIPDFDDSDPFADE